MRRSSLIVGAVLALLLMSAVPVAGRLAPTYVLDASCTTVNGSLQTMHSELLTKQGARESLRAFINNASCIRNTVEYTITPA